MRALDTWTRLQTIALYLYMSIGDWPKVIELLLAQRLVHVAAFTIRALDDAKLTDPNANPMPANDNLVGSTDSLSGLT